MNREATEEIQHFRTLGALTGCLEWYLIDKKFTLRLLLILMLESYYTYIIFDISMMLMADSTGRYEGRYVAAWRGPVSGS